MADYTRTIIVHKKSPLERMFDREEKQRAKASGSILRKFQREKDAAVQAEINAFKKEARGILSQFRTKAPVSILANRIEFTFRGRTYRIVKCSWTLGGESADPDDYKTNHKGWKIFPGENNSWSDSWGHVLFEINEFSTPPRLKPTPEAFCKAIISFLREDENERQRRHARDSYNRTDF